MRTARNNFISTAATHTLLYCTLFSICPVVSFAPERLTWNRTTPNTNHSRGSNITVQTLRTYSSSRDAVAQQLAYVLRTCLLSASCAIPVGPSQEPHSSPCTLASILASIASWL